MCLSPTPQLGPIPAKMRADLTNAEIAMSGSYFEDALRDPRRYTYKVRGPGGVRRRHDTVCTVRIVCHPKAFHVNGRKRTFRSVYWLHFSDMPTYV
jgi:hypothetical protein